MSDNANTRRIYLIKVYTSLLLFAIKRSRPAGKDITDLLHLCLWPLLYFLDFKGETRTPIGILMVGNRDVLRSFVYGFLKTEFAYKKNLTRILPEKNQSSVIVDVGANIGDFSLAMKERAKRIIAIEPGEENFVALTANLRRNYARNVFPVKVAASNSGMDVVLQGGNSDLHIGNGGEGQKAKAATLDSIAKELGLKTVDIMKVDVQGHEEQVVEGMSRLLGDHLINLLIIEIHIDRGVSERIVTSKVEKYGYRLIARDPYLFNQPHLYFAPRFS